MKKLALLALGTITLTGCLSAKGGPDEMAVIEGPGLALPPSFELRPPQDVVTRDIVKETTAEASQKVLFGSKTPQASKISKKDLSSWVLSSAGADKRQENIRDVIDQETE